MLCLDPKLDVVFKLLLTREPKLLQDMLEGVLARPVRTVKVLNPGIPGELASDKQIVLDIRARLDDGARTDLEMQMRNVAALAPRMVYYAARDYASQLGRGEPYGRLTPTVGIVWMLEPLVPQAAQLHSIFELRDRHTHAKLSDHFSIHVLQLPFLKPTGARGYTGRVERWARFLVARDDAQRQQLALEDSIMALAQHNLEQLSQDADVRRMAREREDSIKLYAMHLEASRAQGQAELLLELLGTRFGAISDEVRERVHNAPLERLEVWAKRVLVAASLAEVLEHDEHE